ncbi:SIMPL domain-containing protein [Clostridium amylolyticum]|nr:SIMPL domain-containing protein [Clostridium amylolyticum]
MKVKEEEGKITVVGSGTVPVIPDTAIINIGVVTEGSNLQEVQQENAATTTKVVNSLLSFNIPRENIQTSFYNIEPRYDYKDGTQIFRGYRVTNMLTVKVKSLNDIGAIIDSTVKSGANRIDNITFTVENPSAFYNEALRLAVKNAENKALTIANTLMVQLIKTPIKVTEESPVVPINEYSMIKASAETPVLPGQITITAKITAIYEYA